MSSPPRDLPVPSRRPPTQEEAKALASVLRQRILRLASAHDVTNRELADRLGVDPATSLYHARILVSAGLLKQLPPQKGSRGAYEKPYRSTCQSWWLDDPLAGAPSELRHGPVALSLADAAAAGPDGVSTFATFTLHLGEDELAELDARLLEVIDAYVASDGERAAAGHPVHRGILLLHRPPQS